MSNMDAVFFMEPQSGVVQTEVEWRSDYARMPPEMWGGERFEDAGLVPVIWSDAENRWVKIN